VSGAKCGRLEAQFTVNLTASFVNAAGTTPVTLNGTYFMTEAIAAIAAALGVGWSITLAGGEGGVSTATGLVTIDSATHYPFHVTFTDADFGSLLGFGGNIAATSAPATGTSHALGVWLPATEKFTRHGDRDAGTPETDLRQTVSPSGGVYTLQGNSYDVIDGLRWNGVLGRRTRRHLETTSQESLEYFLRQTQLGEGGLFTAGALVRLYWDAGDTHYVQGRFLHEGRFDPDAMIAGWNGRYDLPFPRLVVTVTA
jgi:hypothetical protein